MNRIEEFVNKHHVIGTRNPNEFCTEIRNLEHLFRELYDKIMENTVYFPQYDACYIGEDGLRRTFESFGITIQE